MGSNLNGGSPVLLDSVNISQGQLSFVVPPGQYSSLDIRISGTNKALNTAAATDIGAITFIRRGSQRRYIGFAALQQQNQYDRGYPTATSATGGAFEFYARLNFSVGIDSNICNIVAADNAQFQIVFPDLVAKTDTGTVEVYGCQTRGVETYEILTRNISQNLSGTGAQIAFNFNAQNVYRMLFQTASDFALLNVTKDTVQKCYAEGSALKASTAMYGQIESAVTFLIVNIGDPNSLADLLGRTVAVNGTAGTLGGATTSPIYYDTIEFSAARTAESVATNNQQVSAALAASPDVKAWIKQAGGTIATTPIQSAMVTES